MFAILNSHVHLYNQLWGVDKSLKYSINLIDVKRAGPKLVEQMLKVDALTNSIFKSLGWPKVSPYRQKFRHKKFESTQFAGDGTPGR